MISGIFEETALMEPAQWERVQKFYEAYLAGRKMDPAGLWPGMLPLYVVAGDTAIINVQGFITRVIDPFLSSLGATSSEEVKNHILLALKTKGINSLVLNINSPGGTVSGIQGLARLIFQMRNLFPINAITDGQMCSCAYWIGAAARGVYISCDSVTIGSIGMIAYRKRSEDPSLMTAIHGKHKGKICTEEDMKEDMKDRCEHTYQAFTSDIALFRNIPLSDIIAMEGLTFIGSNAIKAGLADGFYDLLAWNLNNKLVKKEIA